MEEEKKKTQTFDDAKKILLTAIDTVGGSPEGNIKKGIELLSITLSHPDTVNHAEAKILLEHARIAISDEMAIQFMKTLDDYRRRTISGDDASRDEMIIVRQSQLEALSQGFSTRFKSKVDKGQEEPNIFVCSQYWEGGGKFHNSIETGFYTTLKKNVKRAIEQVAVEGQKQEEKRKAAREESPKLTALIFDIEERPEAFAGRCVYFDDFGMYGKTDKKSDIDYRLQVTDSRGKFYTSVGFAEKEIVFSTSRTVAAQIQALTQDGNKYKVKLYCDMYVSTRNGPWAKVYKIDFYNKGGGIAFTVKD
jgi:hypothetical protein